MCMYVYVCMYVCVCICVYIRLNTKFDIFFTTHGFVLAFNKLFIYNINILVI